MKMSDWLHDMNPKAALAAAARFQKKMEPHLKRYEAAKGAGWQPIATVPVNFPVLARIRRMADGFEAQVTRFR
jgi:hypothetical protein